MPDLTPENTTSKLKRYHDLRQQNAKYDDYVATGQPHDITIGALLEYELHELEKELIEAGVFRDVAEKAVTRARENT